MHQTASTHSAMYRNDMQNYYHFFSLKRQIYLINLMNMLYYLNLNQHFYDGFISISTQKLVNQNRFVSFGNVRGESVLFRQSAKCLCI